MTIGTTLVLLFRKKPAERVDVTVRREQNLGDAAERQPMRRAVARTTRRAGPAGFARGEIIGDELARGGDNDDMLTGGADNAR